MHSDLLEEEKIVIDDALENWLKILITEKEFPPTALAEAMVDDGYPVGKANVLAAAAYIRYGDNSITNLVKSETGRTALELLGQHVRDAIFESCPALIKEQPLIPGDLNRNSIQLNDRTISLQFVAKHPHVALFGNLLSDEECTALIELAKAGLQPSRVIDKLSGDDVADVNTRSSYSMFLRKDEHDWLVKIYQRFAELIRWPMARCEDVALSYYQEGQEFLPHWDYFDTRGENINELLHAGQRIATLVIYLNDVKSGGGTLFPQAGYEIRPQRGCGTYFIYQRSDGSMDSTSLHGGNPVIEGEKWIATFWFVERDIVEHR